MKVYPLKILYNHPKWIKSVYVSDLQKLVLYSFYAPIEIKDVKFDEIKEHIHISLPEDIAKNEGISTALVKEPKKISDDYLHEADLVGRIAKKLWPQYREFWQNEVQGTDAYVPECVKQKISQ